MRGCAEFPLSAVTLFLMCSPVLFSERPRQYILMTDWVMLAFSSELQECLDLVSKYASPISCSFDSCFKHIFPEAFPTFFTRIRATRLECMIWYMGENEEL